MTTVQYNRETKDFDLIGNDGQYLGSRATYTEARNAALDHDLARFRRRRAVENAPTSPVDIEDLHTALVERRLLDAVKLLAPLTTSQVGQVALAYCTHLSEMYGFQKYTVEHVNENFSNAVRTYEMGQMTV